MAVTYECECGKEKFITEFSQLCDNCELKPKIEEGIKNQIIFEAEIKKKILNKKQFVDYVESEIKNASKAITDRLLIQRQKDWLDQKDKYVGTRIMGVIWNSERIKALNSLLPNDDESNKNPFPRIFTSERGYRIFNSFSENVNPNTQLSDYSFIYWKLYLDEFIHQGVAPKEFIDWLNKEFEVTLEKLKQLHLCSPKNREPLYNTLKQLH